VRKHGKAAAAKRFEAQNRFVFGLTGEPRMTLGKRLLAAAIASALPLVPQASHAGIALIVTAPHDAPPTRIAEHPGNVPFKDAVWVDGQWSWKDGRYAWVSGHWQHAPNGFHHWQRGEWAERDGSWFFNSGKWF
jgi:hypothetical protein